MASSVKHLCTHCHSVGISFRAVTWCTECEVFLCEDCEKSHSKSKQSKNHKTLSSKDYDKLPAFINEISSQCKDHKKRFELYCSFHACPCCLKCVSDKHQKCQDLKALSDVLKQVKSSASVQLLKKDLKDVKENLGTTLTYMKTRISTITSQKNKAVEEIKYMRKSINDYLDKLEKEIRNELEFKHSNLESDMTDLVKQMEKRASQINQKQNQFTKIMQYATDLQIYIGLREIEKTTSQTAKYIEDLESGDHFIEKNLEVIISSALQSILQDVKSFGDIDINTTSSTLEIKTGRKDQAQHLISKVPGIEEIKPSFLTTLTIPNDIQTLNILACRILPDGRFIILDNNKKQLLLFSNDGFLIRKVATFTQDPHDACFVRNNTVAVALGTDSQTTLVDIEKNRIIQTIKLSHYCYGVASDGDILVISSNNGQITRVNLNDMSHTILEGMEMIESISLFQGNIYGVIPEKDNVGCFKSTGEPLWIFQHQDITEPTGITLDMKGFVYIACFKNNSIVVVSPDGKTCKTLLSEADGIKSPYGIDINKEIGMMIVSVESIEDSKKYKTVSVYKI